MDDEIKLFTDGRPAAPAYPSQAREAARRRLLDEAAGGGGFRLRLPRLGWQAVGAFGVTIALVGGVGVLSSRTAPVATPGAAATASVAETQPAQFTELAPKPGQYILVQSETMWPVMAEMVKGREDRYLNRTSRKIWQSADGSASGLLWMQGLPPKEFPGWPLPEEVKQPSAAEYYEIDGHCAGTPDDYRTDYAYLSTLPSDAAAMRDYLYKRPHGDNPADDGAWTTVGDLLRETYMPRAQRQAMFEAAKTIPGVEVAEKVEDAAGREGVALGRRSDDGELMQLLFDPESYMLLGERGTVVDAKVAGAPVGSVLSLTAQTGFSVVDKLPEATGVVKDSSCETTAQQPQASASGAPPVQPTATVTASIPATTTDAPSNQPTTTDAPPVQPTATATVTLSNPATTTDAPSNEDPVSKTAAAVPVGN